MFLYRFDIQYSFRGEQNKMVESKILIVEDEIIIAEDLKQELTKLGYKIIGIASKGKEAIKKIKKTRPDIILMDLTLKGELDSIETAQQINKHHNIPLIYISGYFDQKMIQRAKKTQTYGYLKKPIRPLEIDNKIKAALKIHKLQKTLHYMNTQLNQQTIS